jgi:hypothetical protein
MNADPQRFQRIQINGLRVVGGARLPGLALRPLRRGPAHAGLARSGFYVEPTAGACWAALRAGLAGPAGLPAQPPGGVPQVVAPLCGSGLKSHPPG